MERLPEESEAPKPARKLRLPRRPVNDGPAIEPQRPFVVHLLTSPLHLTLAVLSLAPVVILAEALEWNFAGELKVAFIFIIIGLIFFYIGHAFFTVSSAWFKTQKRLSELMATVLFGASALTFMQAFSPEPAQRLGQHIVFAFGWAVLGATWAWDRMRILGEDAQRARLLLLVKGWLAVPGAIGAVFFIFATVILVLAQTGSGGLRAGEMRVWLIWYGSSVCAAMLGWPAFAVELKLREKRRAMMKDIKPRKKQGP